MTKVLKFVGTSALSGVAAFFLATATLSVPACDNGDGPDGDGDQTYCDPGVAGCCKRNKDCGEKSTEWACTPAGMCIRLCKSASECGTGEICEDKVCRPPGCGNDSECGSGQQCVGGACEAAVTASAVTSCEILPTAAVLVDGAEKAFAIVAKDATDKVVAYKGEVTWGASGNVTVSDGTAKGGAASGEGSVTAKVGSVDCEPATVTNYAKAEAGKVRVTVIDLNTQLPVKDVTIRVDGEELTTKTDAKGSVVVDAEGSTRTVTAFHKDYAWVTVVDTTSTDILLYTRKAVAPAKFTGNMDARAFDNLSDVSGNIHLALHGSSIAGNLFDLELASLLGETKEVDIDLGGSLKVDGVPLPGGTVLGLGENMITGGSKTGGFEITAPAGVRTLWGLGGNVALGDVTSAVGPALGGGDIEIGPILTSVLPMLGRLQSGALTGVNGEPGKTTSIDAGGKSTLMLNTLLRLRAEVKVPELPTFKYMDGATEKDGSFEGAIVLGGALNGSQGLVPLGLTAGIDADTDGVVDADDASGVLAGNVALRFAPLHSGMETSQYAIVGLAASFGGLFGGDDSGDGPGLVLSGLVSYPKTNDIGFKNGQAAKLSLGESFLNVPSKPSIDNGTRTLNAGSKVDTASFQRLSVGDSGEEWLVYFAPGADTSVTLPEPPTGMNDRLVASSGKQPQALLHSVRLGSSGLKFDDVVGFSGENMDDLTKQVDAFSVIAIKR